MRIGFENLESCPARKTPLKKDVINSMMLLSPFFRVLFLASFSCPAAFGFVAVSSCSTISGFFDRLAVMSTNLCSEQPLMGKLFPSPFLRYEFQSQSALRDSSRSNYPKRGAFGLIMRSFPGRKSQEKQRQNQIHHALSKVMV